MSQANVDTLGWILEQAFEGRRVDPELLADDVEWVNPQEAVEPGTRRGVDEFNRALASIFDAWDEVRFETERVMGSGDDVVALGRLRIHIHGPGMEVVTPHGQVWTFRDGRAVRMRWFNTHRETLEAAGLRE
jgi:ketosteroid isomerase-like protein